MTRAAAGGPRGTARPGTPPSPPHGEDAPQGTATGAGGEAVRWRIGEVAKLTGVTTRTLRYWDELGLLTPSGHGRGGERLYAPADVARVERIRKLQELLGFSLAEVRTVLGTGDVDVLDRVRSELRSGDLPPARRRALLDEGIAANDQLLARLDETLARLQAFRDERAGAALRLRAARDELGEEPAPARAGGRATGGRGTGARAAGRAAPRGTGRAGGRQSRTSGL